MANAGDESQVGDQNTPQSTTSKLNASSKSSKGDKSRVTVQAGSGGSNGGNSHTNPGNALGSFCIVKLNHENYLLWKSMVLPVIRGNRLEGFINGTKECPPEFLHTEVEGSTDVDSSTDVAAQQNPDFETWMAQDQNLLGWLYNSIDIEVASKVMGNETSKDLWKALEILFGVQTRSNIVFFKKEFRRMQKGGMKMSEYLKAMKKLADNLALAGQPIGKDDLVSQVLSGLDSLEYNPIVCQINEKENVSWMELLKRIRCV